MDFYEDDEPIQDVARAFGDGPHPRTKRPTHLSMWVSDSRLPVQCQMTTTAAFSALTFMGVPMVRVL